MNTDNPTTLIAAGVAALAVIGLPLAYVVFGSKALFGDPNSGKYHGRPISIVEEQDGAVRIPTSAEDRKGLPLQARLSGRLLEELSGVRPRPPEALEMNVEIVDSKLTDCLEGNLAPRKASFDLQSSCAKQELAAAKTEDRVSLFVDPDMQLVVLGHGAKRVARLYHDGLAATFVLPAMTQGDMKKQACVAKVMLDYLFADKQVQTKACAATAS